MAHNCTLVSEPCDKKKKKACEGCGCFYRSDKTAEWYTLGFVDLVSISFFTADGLCHNHYHSVPLMI